MAKISRYNYRGGSSDIIQRSFIEMHSIGIEKEFEDIKEIVEKYSLDDPKEEIMADYLEAILNPIKIIE